MGDQKPSGQFRGILGLNNDSVDVLFSDKAGHPVFRATMSRNRFKLLLSNLMFDDQLERIQKWSSDRFTAIRTLYEMFNLNCMKHVVPSEFLSLDETQYPMRNQISIKQYNANKPAKYGLLFKSINDARYPYTSQSLVYSGKPENGDGPHYLNQTEDYVKTLVEIMGAKLPMKEHNNGQVVYVD